MPFMSSTARKGLATSGQLNLLNNRLTDWQTCPIKKSEERGKMRKFWMNEQIKDQNEEKREMNRVEQRKGWFAAVANGITTASASADTPTRPARFFCSICSSDQVLLSHLVVFVSCDICLECSATPPDFNRLVPLVMICRIRPKPFFGLPMV